MIVLSDDPDTKYLQSGLTSTLQTVSVCPSNFFIILPF
jgi:hypothetical protein